MFFTTTEAELIYLDDAIFEVSAADNFSATDYRTDRTDSVDNSTEKESLSPEVLAKEKTFKNIPYSSIIAEWWRRNGGEPAEGERNVKLHKLAVNLRAICDNKKEVLMQVMPRFGLSDVEPIK